MQIGSRGLLAEGRLVEFFPDWSGENVHRIYG
jgi:hypothetical protein